MVLLRESFIWIKIFVGSFFRVPPYGISQNKAPKKHSPRNCIKGIFFGQIYFEKFKFVGNFEGLEFRIWAFCFRMTGIFTPNLTLKFDAKLYK